MDTRQVRTLTRRACVTLRACEEKAKGRKTHALRASVRHAHQLAADFAARRHGAVVLDGRTRNRDEILDRFRRGDVELLLNYNVLTEAFDARRRTRWGLAPSSADQGG